MTASTGSLRDPASLLAELNAEQRKAVEATTGPVCILAGAGSGKTRVIARRAAYAAAIGAVAPERILIVSFTDKAAGEMERRIADLGLRHAMVKTVHSFARLQLSWLWPRTYGGNLPGLLTSKYRIVADTLRRRSIPIEPLDVISEIDWAKRKGIGPTDYVERLMEHTPGVDAELVAYVYAQYESRKKAMGRLDFDDLLLETAKVLRDRPDLAAIVRRRRNWISVDEYQDTNELQQDLFNVWLGDEIDDFCVVGDVDQAIFGWAGASADYLTGFQRRFPTASMIELSRNYRSTPQILEVANRLLAAEGRQKRLVSTLRAGPAAILIEHESGERELGDIVGRIKELHDGGVGYEEMAILVRLRAHLVAIEQALQNAAIPYRSVEPFFERADVRMAIDALAQRQGSGDLLTQAKVTWEALFGIALDDRMAEDSRRDAVVALLDVARTLMANRPTATVEDLRRVFLDLGAEELHGGQGVDLLTYHKAKGLEWKAVFLPRLEEGTLPDFRAKSPPAQVEEWRLLYVGITRAERHLVISWARKRLNANGSERSVASSTLLEPLRRLSRANPARTHRAEQLRATDQLAPGARVFHTRYGNGIVVRHRTLTVTVRFDGSQTRDFTWPSVALKGTLLRRW